MPLVLAPCGQEMKIVKILADEKTKKHLANLGVIVGSQITVLSSSGGSSVCIVKEGRLAFDRQVASRIFVA
ncbi:MAG: ferrous iron transport protein A [Clostridia bacterium]|nr:ferrous iron transport protein A [Clostridia bacterium]MDE6677127.1 ferrous iron transport protein A [Clostridia bacterium]